MGRPSRDFLLSLDFQYLPGRVREKRRLSNGKMLSLAKISLEEERGTGIVVGGGSFFVSWANKGGIIPPTKGGGVRLLLECFAIRGKNL